MKEKPDVMQGTLALMVLKTLDVLEPQHGLGIASMGHGEISFFETPIDYSN
jgi:hypothetical protein